MASLPEDPQTPGNVWCEACQQSISKSRGDAHLVSAKHKSKTQKPGATSSEASEPEPQAEPKAESSSKKPSAKGHRFPPDPEKPGNFWCGICEVSLTASKADEHDKTTRHVSAAAKYVNEAVKTTRSKASK